VITQWLVRLSGSNSFENWDWRQRGAPPVDALVSVRRPHSSKRNRHIPVTAYSMTNGDHIVLESGLEHDLLRRVDRDPAVRRITAQPFRLAWAGSTPGFHIPDLLTLDVDGSVTVWDARPPEGQDDEFLRAVAETREACSAVGWAHEIFSGLELVERLNLLWLHGFRRPPPWLCRYERQILTAAQDGTTIEQLFALDQGDGEVISCIWHLVWTGALRADITAVLDPKSSVECPEAYHV
ncbi:hypothetical protein MRAB57_1581, partial [Mycobacterium rhizamassiliense]